MCIAESSECMDAEKSDQPVKTLDCIQGLCKEFRELFSSDADMARELRLDLNHVQGLLNGDLFPTLPVMIEIQAALRKVALFKNRAYRSNPSPDDYGCETGRISEAP